MEDAFVFNEPMDVSIKKKLRMKLNQTKKLEGTLISKINSNSNSIANALRINYDDSPSVLAKVNGSGCMSLGSLLLKKKNANNAVAKGSFLESSFQTIQPSTSAKGCFNLASDGEPDGQAAKDAVKKEADLNSVTNGIKEVKQDEPQFGLSCFTYKPQHDDELALELGLVVEISNTKCNEDGWMFAKLGSDDGHSKRREGLVPKKCLVFIGPSPNRLHSVDVEKSDEKLIAEGSFGAFYKGTHDGKDVAVKVAKLRPKKSDEEKEELNGDVEFEREALILCQLNHENIVKCYGLFASDASSPNDHSGLVFELCQGGPLSRISQMMPQSDFSLVVYWAIQIASAMEYLHRPRSDDSIPFVHGDLRAENVLIKEEPCECGFSDGSWSLLVRYDQRTNCCRKCKRLSIFHVSLKLTGMLLCRSEVGERLEDRRKSVPWMAPSVIRYNERQKTAVDVWSFGVLFWELFSCTPPFADKSIDSVAYAIALKRVKLPLPANCPDQLKLLFGGCWRIKSDDRLNFAEIVEKLKQIEDDFNIEFKWDVKDEMLMFNEKLDEFENAREQIPFSTNANKAPSDEKILFLEKQCPSSTLTDIPKRTHKKSSRKRKHGEKSTEIVAKINYEDEKTPTPQKSTKSRRDRNSRNHSKIDYPPSPRSRSPRRRSRGRSPVDSSRKSKSDSKRARVRPPHRSSTRSRSKSASVTEPGSSSYQLPLSPLRTPSNKPREFPSIRRSVDGSHIAPFFTNAYGFSNHFPTRFVVDGMEFNCSEQYYMYYKAMCFGENKIAKQIMALKDPKAMKRLCTGNALSGFNSTDWKHISTHVMTIGCYHKFKQNQLLRTQLFRTGEALLVEAAPSDFYWGIGLGPDDPAIEDKKKWQGENLLGRILTKLREALKLQFPDEWIDAQRKNEADVN